MFNFATPQTDTINVINQTIDAQWQFVISQYLINGKLHNNANGVRHEDFKRYMEEVITIRRDRLVGVQDLQARGLMASEEVTTTIIGVERLNEFRDAIRTMGEVTDDNNDTNFDEILTPMPITHSGWSIQARQGFGYKRSRGLSESVRTVSKSLDTMLFSGASEISFGGNEVFGYQNHPFRITDTISDWTDEATNQDKIVGEFIDLVNQMVNNAFVEGSNQIMVYIAPDLWAAFAKDYKAEANKTVRQRLLDNLDILIDIKVSHRVTSKTVVMVNMNSDTVQMHRAADINLVPHALDKGPILSTQKFTTFAIMVPVITPDRDNNLAILTANDSGG